MKRCKTLYSIMALWHKNKITSNDTNKNIPFCSYSYLLFIFVYILSSVIFYYRIYLGFFLRQGNGALDGLDLSNTLWKVIFLPMSVDVTKNTPSNGVPCATVVFSVTLPFL